VIGTSAKLKASANNLGVLDLQMDHDLDIDNISSILSISKDWLI